MFYVTYMLSELRRRRGRTVLTALGLAVGVGLVVTASALSAGLDRAQAEVLRPLTGVGTDLSVSRPLDISAPTGGGFPRLSARERDQLRRENGPARLGLRDLGAPGTRFSRDDFVSSQLSFSAAQVRRLARLDGVRSAAGGLTLTAIHVEGEVPEESARPQRRLAPMPGGGPESIDLTSLTVTGVDETRPSLGALTPGLITRGAWFGRSGEKEAILTLGYARRQKLEVGDTFRLAGKRYTVVGLAKAPIGGQASDAYVKLRQLQALAGRKGRVNTVYVRATGADEVAALSRRIEKALPGASVTTAADLAERVSGSLVDARNVADKLGAALAAVGLVAAFLIASLLSLSSVTKRVRELGTLKALGWPRRLVVRQVTGESLLQGLLGGALGAVAGVAGALLVARFAPDLEATVAQTAAHAPGPVAVFGQGSVTPGSETVDLDAPVGAGLLVLAVGLALLGGLLSGAVGALRAARLRPADALRHLD